MQIRKPKPAYVFLTIGLLTIFLLVNACTENDAEPYSIRSLTIEPEPDEKENNQADSIPDQPDPEIVEESASNHRDSNEEEVYDVVEVEPQYKGGDQALSDFIRNNVVYPELAIQMAEQGKVFVRFIVEKDGRINHVSIARKVTPALDKEAIRVIMRMPKWIPGMQNGKPVRTSVVLPIVFKLS